MDGAGGTSLTEVLRVVDALREVGCRFWLEGGWGVDALLGRQTRPHRDVDIDLDARHERAALAAVEALGYAVETDERPVRIELLAPGRGRVDLHPLGIRADGSATQAAPDGGVYEFPAASFTVGSLGDTPVPCVTAAMQRASRQGYELREVDRHDLAVLGEPVSPSTPVGLGPRRRVLWHSVLGQRRLCHRRLPPTAPEPRGRSCASVPHPM